MCINQKSSQGVETKAAKIPSANLSLAKKCKKFLGDLGTYLFGGGKIISSFALALVFVFTFVGFFNLGLAIPVIIALGLILAFANSITTYLSRFKAIRKFFADELMTEHKTEEERKPDETQAPEETKKHLIKTRILRVLAVVSSIGAGATAYFGIVQGVASLLGFIISGSMTAPIVAVLMTNPILLAVAGVLALGGAVAFLCFQMKDIDKDSNNFLGLFQGNLCRKILAGAAAALLFLLTGLSIVYSTTKGVNSILFGIKLVASVNTFSPLTWIIGPILFVPTIITGLFSGLYKLYTFIFPGKNDSQQPLQDMWSNYLKLPPQKKITYPIIMFLDLAADGARAFVSAIGMLMLIGLGTPAALIASPWIILALGLALINMAMSFTFTWSKIIKNAVDNPTVKEPEITLVIKPLAVPAKAPQGGAANSAANSPRLAENKDHLENAISLNTHI
jgi:hypothetical protein